MCERCESEMKEMGVDPENLMAQMGMAMSGELERRDRENDQRVRLACLDLAVKVKGDKGDSRLVLKSAHSYYAFVSGSDKSDPDPEHKDV